MQKQINFDLSSVAGGGLQEKLNHAIEKVTKNILDPNTDQTKKRKIQINMVFSPAKSGEAVDVDTQVKTTLVPENGVGTTLLIGKSDEGTVIANELKSGTKGQTFIDPETGELKTDTGQPVSEVEAAEQASEKKVIDLQAKKG
ncbi:replication terminator protein [Liquorilactobacillus satsumensis]|uniref:replication terminator protein n=1 Tax=Liquorilactobacillus satsumensis TaxID=259059 RepID=UPI0039ED28B3